MRVGRRYADVDNYLSAALGWCGSSNGKKGSNCEKVVLTTVHREIAYTVALYQSSLFMYHIQHRFVHLTSYRALLHLVTFPSGLYITIPTYELSR